MSQLSARVARNVQERLLEARRSVGKSTRAVCESLRRRDLAVSHTTLANYEKGVSVPPIDVLTELARIYGRPVDWFLGHSPPLRSMRYRHLASKVGVKARRQFEAQAARWLDAYFRLEDHLRRPLGGSIRQFSVEENEQPASLAQRLRKKLQLRDTQPVISVIEVLERRGVHVIEISQAARIDGLACRFDGHPAVVLNAEPGKAVDNDRFRMNAAHELGHLFFGDTEEASTAEYKATEKRAYEFASYFLIPQSQLELAFDRRSFLRLIEFKERFGISLAAMVYRAEKTRVVDSKTARWLWMQFSQRGWRTNEPGAVWRDRAMRFERLLERATLEKRMSWREAEIVTGIRERDLRQRLEAAIGTWTEEEDESTEAIVKFKATDG